MAKKISDLAARFNAALAGEEDSKKAAEEQEKAEADRIAKLKAEAQAARTELLGELHAFGKSLTAVTVNRQKSGKLKLTFRENILTFSPDGDGGNVSVSYDGAPDDEHLYRAEDGDDVVWVLARGDVRAPLIMDGLDDLMVTGLGFPAPADFAPLADSFASEPEPEPEPEPEHHHYEEPEAAYEEPPPSEVYGGEPLNTEERMDVREALQARRQEQKHHRGTRTRVEGATHEPWNSKVTNPGPKKKKKVAADPNRIKAGQQTSDYDARPTQSKKDNPRRKRKFAVDSGVGSAVKPYKPII